MPRQEDKRIVVVDDEPRKARQTLLDLADDEVVVLHPEELEEKHLQEAALVLVDHHLEQDQWPRRSKLPFACQPQDGRALAAIVQAYLRTNGFRSYGPTAVALLSGKLYEVTPDLEAPPPEHLAARACGLDWAFAKSQGPGGNLPARIRSFAGAVRDLPLDWPKSPDRSREAVAKLLGISDQDWKEIALLQADRCHPPVHELAVWTRGMAFIRWLAQLILPYRTFLLDHNHLAIRLGVAPSWLASSLDGKNGLSRELDRAQYRGILSELQGPRWWLAGVDAELWQATDGRSIDRDEVWKWLGALTSGHPEALSDQETLVLGADFRFNGQTARYSECVRVWPDDWPAFAETPWTKIAMALSNDRLRAVVLAEDLERLSVNEA